MDRCIQCGRIGPCEACRAALGWQQRRDSALVQIDSSRQTCDHLYGCGCFVGSSGYETVIGRLCERCYLRETERVAKRDERKPGWFKTCARCGEFVPHKPWEGDGEYYCGKEGVCLVEKMS